ncbi:MAG: phosphonoacetaldehyde reductase [Bacteroidales bacterium]|nr:phosphonoacetaldehyde reductase [Bacteroidales bacterium]
MQRVFTGESAIEYFYSILDEISPTNIFLVRGKSSYKTSGAVTVITAAVVRLNCKVTEFYDFCENPRIEDLEKGLSLLSGTNADLIIGTGGGSVMDMSKLIRFFHSYTTVSENTGYIKQKDLLPLINIPTTAGTGSEATHFAVLYKNKMKYSIEHEDILPDVAIVYPPFTYNNPKYLTACTGFDALAQAIEAYWNVNATAESDEYALKATGLLWKNLPKVVNHPSVKTRDIVSEGSYWAGKAINITKTTAPHAFSYPFTIHYGYPHGHAVAMTFPFWADFNISALRRLLPAKADILLSTLNINDDNVCSKFVDYINNLSLDLHLAPAISIDSILSNINMERLKNNPGIINLNIDIAYQQIKKYFNNIKNEK